MARYADKGEMCMGLNWPAPHCLLLLRAARKLSVRQGSAYVCGVKGSTRETGSHKSA